MSTGLNRFVAVDPNKCIGCRVCEVACSVAHADHVSLTASTVNTPMIPRLYVSRTADGVVPIQCRHCEDAPCAKACKVSAIVHLDDKILIHEDQCIGCKACAIACPFGAIDMVPVLKNNIVGAQDHASDIVMELDEVERWVASKCDLCDGREEGPACVQECPQQALRLVDIHREKKERNARAAESLLTLKNFSHKKQEAEFHVDR